MAIFLYAVRLLLVSGAFYGYYHLFLRNKRFHRYNRFYLLSASLLSFIIPLLKIPLFMSGSRPGGGLIRTLNVIAANGWEEPVTIYAHRNSLQQWITVQNGLYTIYLAGLLTGLVVLFRTMAYINGLKKMYPFEIMDDLKFFNTSAPGPP